MEDCFPKKDRARCARVDSPRMKCVRMHARAHTHTLNTVLPRVTAYCNIFSVII